MKNNFTNFFLNFASLLLFRRILFVSAVLLFFSSSVHSQTQIQIKLQQPPPNQLSIADLYNIELNNTSKNDVEFYLYGTLNESKAGLIASATTVPIKLKANERRRFKASDLPKTPEVSYPSRDNRYKDALMRKGSLPDGNYTICVYAKQTGTNDELGSDCRDNEIKIEQEVEVSLLTPENKAEINPEEPLIFTWAVLGNLKGPYKIKIVEIKGDQSPEAGYRTNKPIFEKGDIDDVRCPYPSTGAKLQPGKRYAWQISIGKVVSEISTFMIVSGGGQITVSLTPVIAANCCFAVNVNNTTGSLTYDAFRMTLPTNTIQSANPVNCSIMPNAPPITNNMLWKGQGDFQAGTNNYGTVCFTSVSAPFKVFIQWSTNGGESYANVMDTLTVNCGQTTPSSFCTDFENGTISNWITYNTYNGVTSTQTGNLQNVTPGSNINPSNNALKITDVFGSTFIYNKVNFTGNYSQFTGSCLCYDFKLTTNAAGANVYPRIYLLQNFDETQPLVWGTNPQIGASFSASVMVTSNSNWVHICAPLGPCTGGKLPTSSDGTWAVHIGGDTCTNWTNLLSNVSAVMFAVDMSGWGGQEIFEIDNVCIMNCNEPPGSSNPCDSFNATVSPSPVGNCCGVINLNQPQNLTGVNTIEFLPLGQNTFLSGSLGSGYTGYMYTSSSPQNYTVKKNSGVPGGQLNGFFNFCLSTLSSPQQIVVNWKNDNTIVCTDTVTVNCNIPCVTFNKDTLVCSGSNYNLTYSITNNSNFSIGVVEYTVLSPSGAVITPVSSTISPSLGSNQTSSPITAVISGANENTNLCILMKYKSPDNCCWCYDTLCITTPSCICEDVSASITGDPYNCCYDLNLINNATPNYFTQVKLKTESGTMFSTWTATGSGWGSMNIFPANEIQYVLTSGFIPTGNLNSILNFCLAGFTTSPQKILVEWIKDAEIVCVDTLTTICPPREEPKNNCAQIINSSIECLANGTFKYNFQIQNNSNNTTTGFMLNPISPSGLSLSPADFPNVSIGPNGISTPQSLIISGVGEGVNVCFETAIYKHVGQTYSWCCHGDTVCVTTPVCKPPEPSCKFDAKVINVECKSMDQNGNPIYLVEFKVTNPASTQVTLNSITSGSGNMLAPYLPDVISPGTSTFFGTFVKNSNSGNPTCFNFSFTDPKSPKDTCKVNACTDLPNCFKPPEKPCEIKSKVIEVKCKGKDENGNPLYYIEIKINNGSGSTAVLNSITSNNLYLSNGNIPAVLNTGSTTMEFGFTMKGEPVNSTCFTFSYTDPKNPKDTCKETVCTDLPKCEDVKDCECDKKWSGNISVGSTTIKCNSKVIKTVNAGQTTVTAPSYNCIAPCVPKYKYTVKKSGQIVTSGTGNNSFSYNFPAGTYTIMYEVYCGEKLCGECMVTVIFSGGNEGPK